MKLNGFWRIAVKVLIIVLVTLLGILGLNSMLLDSASNVGYYTGWILNFVDICFIIGLSVSIVKDIETTTDTEE